MLTDVLHPVKSTSLKYYAVQHWSYITPFSRALFVCISFFSTCILALIVLNPTHWLFMVPHTVLCVQCVLILPLFRAAVAKSPGPQRPCLSVGAHTLVLCVRTLVGAGGSAMEPQGQIRPHVCLDVTQKNSSLPLACVCFFIQGITCISVFICKMYGSEYKSKSILR